jgi:hypothetical protein
MLCISCAEAVLPQDQHGSGCMAVTDAQLLVAQQNVLGRCLTCYWVLLSPVSAATDTV